MVFFHWVDGIQRLFLLRKRPVQFNFITVQIDPLAHH
jgi:hypothetical protein